MITECRLASVAEEHGVKARALEVKQDFEGTIAQVTTFVFSGQS